MISRDPAMRQVFELVERVGASDAAVTILGETGTGKELVARALHARSARRDGPFIPVNCSAIAETLIESELFGHEKGAFSGAERMRKGAFEEADRGHPLPRRDWRAARSTSSRSSCASSSSAR